MAAEEFLRKLPRVPVQELPVNSTCEICLREYGAAVSDDEVAEVAVKLPCGHVIGSECIATWLSKNGKNTCPYCRHQFFSLYHQFPGEITLNLPGSPTRARQILAAYDLGGFEYASYFIQRRMPAGRTPSFIDQTWTSNQVLPTSIRPAPPMPSMQIPPPMFPEQFAPAIPSSREQASIGAIFSEPRQRPPRVSNNVSGVFRGPSPTHDMPRSPMEMYHESTYGANPSQWMPFGRTPSHAAGQPSGHASAHHESTYASSYRRWMPPSPPHTSMRSTMDSTDPMSAWQASLGGHVGGATMGRGTPGRNIRGRGNMISANSSRDSPNSEHANQGHSVRVSRGPGNPSSSNMSSTYSSRDNPSVEYPSPENSVRGSRGRGNLTSAISSNGNSIRADSTRNILSNLNRETSSRWRGSRGNARIPNSSNRMTDSTSPYNHPAWPGFEDFVAPWSYEPPNLTTEPSSYHVREMAPLSPGATVMPTPEEHARRFRPYQPPNHTQGPR